MQRYFVPFDANNLVVTIEGEDAHHIKHVMRMRVGDSIILTNGEEVFTASIDQLGEGTITCRLLERRDDQSELPIHVAIAQGIPKGDKLELVIQKATELGVSEIIPVESERSIVKLDQKKEAKRHARYLRIAKEASEQSHRRRMPTITPFLSFKQFLTHAKDYTYCLVAYEGAGEAVKGTLQEVLTSLKPKDTLLVYIGPEGGLSETELHQMLTQGFQMISLGNRILRTETAPLFVMSAVVYELELKGR